MRCTAKVAAEEMSRDGIDCTAEFNAKIDQNMTAEEIYREHGWTVSLYWNNVVTRWDGHIFCPDHEVLADDWMSREDY